MFICHHPDLSKYDIWKEQKNVLNVPDIATRNNKFSKVNTKWTKIIKGWIIGYSIKQCS